MHRIILTKSTKQLHPDFYSIEAGVADNIQHFDHHKEEHNMYPSPCNNTSIKPIEDDGSIKYIQISHLDSDTFIGIVRLLGVNHILREPLEFNMMEYIDLNGSKGINKDNPTYQFMVGVGVLARKLNFPRITDEPQDVTDIVQQMLDTSVFSFIQYGKCSIDKAEADYKECMYSQQGNMGLWVVDATHDFNPSRPYEDEIQVVIVYRPHYKSISIYADPDSDYSFAGQTISGIEFNGHAKACGSPRGQEMTLEDAIEVYSIL
jgi:hypothetical protein